MDVVAVSDPLWNPMGGGWEFGRVFGAAAWVTGFNGKCAMDDLTVRRQFHVAVVVEGLIIVACYLRPNQSRAEFDNELEELEQLRRGWRGPIIFCGDFNAQSPAWGASSLSRRGVRLQELIERLDLYPIQAEGSGYTFTSDRGRTSMIDFGFCDAQTLRAVERSKILENIETRSDHLYVLHQLRTPQPTERLPLYIWEPKSLEVEAMKSAYDRRVGELPTNRPWGEEDVRRYLGVLQEVCVDSMRPAKKPSRPTRVGTVGWTPERRALRKEANRLRRRKQRAHRLAPEVFEERNTQYRKACSDLGNAMRKARTEAWREMCRTLDTDMWGRPYKIMMARLKAKNPPPTLTYEMATEVLLGLFPIPEEEEARGNPMTGIEYPHRLPTEDPAESRVHIDELQEAIHKINLSKPPGRDSVPPIVVKGVGNHDPTRLLALANQIITSEVFSK